MSIYLGYVLGSVVLDIIANVLLQLSDGFRHKRWGIAAVLCIMAAFALLALAVTGMELFLAYALWGALSISGTALATRWLFNHRLNRWSWTGLAILIVAIILMQWGGH
ncbi:MULTISPECIES: SMR family transporter [Marinobacter]|uniref:Spermidine export protein MdtI n=1 Tax=Marinobacter xestospongiae TaxID=994319 RepID=A0ABU3VT41_9GAMM|nr:MULTISPECIES: SMR family transporter [Marinobacter]MCG8519030.1 SMR family transporter [Pseudomonadales bacterium]MCK7567530.1 SMR family transporter [Marinobacter xestospongiae]MDV2077424.1 SMR family transporter [Marinobacter xestospongiae]UDL04250.1 multidrug transporter subunit MdtI [Marinobacter sp. CA1]